MELKNTKSRNLILDLLNKQDAPITANEIFKQLVAHKITLSTIYRTLDKFSNEKIIKKENGADGSAVFFVPTEKHCHILECKNCHNTIKLQYCPYDKINDKIKKDTNFEVDEDNIVIYGLCKKCNNKD